MIRRGSIGSALAGLAARWRGRARSSQAALERELRQVLEESASPSCCFHETVARIRNLAGPPSGESESPAGPKPAARRP